MILVFFVLGYRAECSLEKLRALNDYVKIHVSTKPLSEENLEQFSVIEIFLFQSNKYLILVYCLNGR